MTLNLDPNHTIVNFNKNTTLHDWCVVNDVVMGGKSTSEVMLNKNGNAVFKGKVSLENNGGFSLLRHRFYKLDISNFKTIKIRLKGDGKKYQFRIKPSRFNQYSYVQYIQTAEDWETIKIDLTDFTPIFRGRQLEMPNFNELTIEEISFLIGNKLQEKFKLIIESVVLE
ncbi:CIA30 family protein [Lutibacter sp. A64]|uniref:CIA30 family protein n=1 Tax=Lutibacter sp. A64 TaxID=2918526 RepID=UPI001F057B4F|nr:CIA30 family protein [Lutibacter sp. A64]UMB55066.1 CIA30 family protein [Lutibacter sp. A64]